MGICPRISDNNKILTQLRDKDPYALLAIARFCRNPTFTFWLQTCYPNDIRPLLPPLQRSLDDLVSAAYGSAAWLDDELTKLRMRLPVSGAGGGCRDLDDLSSAAFLGTLWQVAPMLIPIKSSSGDSVDGWANRLEAVFGKGAFDPEAEGQGRFSGFLQYTVGAAGAARTPLRDATALRVAYGRCRNELSEAERKDGPLEPKVADCGYGFERRGQRALTAAREKPRAQALLASMLTLDEMDPRRMAFLEASAKDGGAPIRAVMSSWPTQQRHITPDQFHTGACTYMGLPIPALVPFVGNQIGSTGRRLDAHGHQLASATLKGDGWRIRHDGVQDALATGLKACHVDAKLEVLNLFLPFCPAAAREHLTGRQGRRNWQGVIPDILAKFDPSRLIFF